MTASAKNKYANRLLIFDDIHTLCEQLFGKSLNALHLLLIAKQGNAVVLVNTEMVSSLEFSVQFVFVIDNLKWYPRLSFRFSLSLA